MTQEFNSSLTEKSTRRNQLKKMIGFSVLALGLAQAGQSYAASLLEWNTAGNAGNETTEPSTFNVSGVGATNLTVGAGITPMNNGNRFGGANWWETGESVTGQTLADAIADNEYIEFIITPDAGFKFTATGFNFIWDRSSSGPNAVALRSSADSFAADLASASNLAPTIPNLATFTNLSFSLNDISVATTFRLYGFGSAGTPTAGGTAGFDTNTGTVPPNVLLLGSVSAIGVFPNYFDTNGSTAGIGINGGTAIWDAATTNWNPSSAGTGTPAVYDPAQQTIFGGTAGTVTVSGTVNPANGIQFKTDAYVLSGGTAINLAGATPALNVITTDTAVAATISTPITGTQGLTKSGNGTLVLTSASNSFSGGVVIEGGTLSISSDGNLGDSSNSVTLNSGTLKTISSLTTARGINGSGSLIIPTGSTFTATGTVAATAVTLPDSGTLDLQGSNPSLGALTLSGPSGVLVTSTTGSIISASTITATNLTGNATISTSGGLFMGSGSKTLDVGANGVVKIPTFIGLSGAGNQSLRKTGAGTLELTGVNNFLWRIQLGSNSVTTPTTGGLLRVNNNQALGTNQVFVNVGTLEAMTDLTGANAFSIGLSTGGLTNAPPVLAGSNMEFNGESTVFMTNAAQNQLVVNNTTTLNGAFGTSAAAVTPPALPAVATGFTLSGTGKLVVNNATNVFQVPITVQGSLELNGGLTAPGMIVDPAGTVVTNAFQMGATSTLTVNGSATVRTNGGAAGASKVETLTVGAGGKLNLKDNDIVVGTGTVANVRTAIKTGVAGAAGITSDLPAFGVTTGFGYALGNDSALSPLLAGNLTGQSYDADSVLVKYTFLGDADLDGDSDLNDLGLWAAAFTGDLGNPVTPVTFWTSGDFDYDGDTDLNDLGFWAGTFTGDLGGGAGSLIVNAPGAPAGAVAALNSMGITVVPEPSTFVLAGVGLVGLAVASRRKCRA